jgi:hypothetical protein
MDAYEVVPILNVSDVPASAAWFQALGWQRGFTWEGELGDPVFGAVTNGSCQVFLCLDGQGGRGDQAAWLSVFVPDVDAVAKTAALVGAEVLAPAEDKPWGVRELLLRHPDGHVLRVSQEGVAAHDEYPHGHDHPHDDTD